MGRQDWRTPPSVFELLDELFGPFETDAAADMANHLCKHWLESAGGPPCSIGWKGNVFINPPFGDIMPWVVLADKYARRNTDFYVIMLTPANTSSPWFWEAAKNAMLLLPDRRIAFWHPDEKPGSPDRDTVVWHFGAPVMAVGRISIPGHAKEVRRLCAEAGGQGALFEAGALL